MEKPSLLPCAHCGRPVELQLRVMDDEDKYPRPHWHALISCDCGVKLGWEAVSTQLQDNHDYVDQSSIDQKWLDDFCATWNRRT